ncbi:MAG: clostripain-related cysteine peptidase [Elusimicrobiales bacterium]|nr:clostripain-related cysteine peptidase [Elusimicrobiales bacterium]
MNLLNKSAKFFAVLLGLACGPAHLCAMGGNTDISALLETARQVPVPQARANSSGLDGGPIEKEWTIMVYINGKNNLANAALYNMNQMEIVGSTDKMNVVVETGRLWDGVRRYLIVNDFQPSTTDQAELQSQYVQAMHKINSPVVQELPKTDMGDYKSAVDFVKWSREKYPAKKYMLILWDHGTGWMDPLKKKSEGAGKSRAISLDDETGNFIGTVEIGKLVREVSGVNVLGFDACLMQMAEVAYEVKDSAKIILGSEEVVPEDGIDYTGFLAKLSSNPSASPEEAAGYAAEAFNKYYASSGKAATMSVIRSDALPGLASSLDAWGAVALQTKNVSVIQAARDKVLRFKEFGDDRDPLRVLTTYTDIYHFMQLVAENTTVVQLKQASLAVMQYVAGTLVAKNTALGKEYPPAGLIFLGGTATVEVFDYSNAHGIAVNVPRVRSDITAAQLEDKEFSNKYSDLAFAKAAGRWNDFCQWMSGSVPASGVLQPAGISHIGKTVSGSW